MIHPPAGKGSLLMTVARKAMVDNGLQPDFDAAAVQQLASISQAASDASAEIRDLRQLLWASIDNDNSRDLDQLSVADPVSGGSVRIWWRSPMSTLW